MSNDKIMNLSSKCKKSSKSKRLNMSERNSLIIVFAAVMITAGSLLASANANPVEMSSEELVQDKNGYLQVSFKYLGSYKYFLPTEEEIEKKEFKDQVPQFIKDLNGKKIVIEGFLMVSEFEDKKLKKLLLFSSYLGCCFGNIPGMNEWIYVDMEKAQKMKFFHGMLIKVYGTFEVGETLDWDKGISLYRMKGDKIESPFSKKR